jgi:HK97 family phage major capsid protein
MGKLNDLLEKRSKVVNDQRAILDTVDKEKRSMTADENTTYEALDKAFVDVDAEIKTERDALEQQAKRMKDVEQRQEDLKKSQREPIKPTPPKKGDEKPNEKRFLEYDIPARYKDIIEGYREQTGGRYATREYNEAFRHCLVDQNERYSARALQADIDTSGGYLVTPEQFVARLIQKKDNMVFVRRLATVIPVPNAASLGAPALDNDPGDPTWTAEIKTGSEDSTLDFDKRQLFPHPLARRIKVSKKLLEVAVMNVDAIVRDRLAYKFAVVEENVFLNGTGQNQPLGVMVASANGINTGRDMSTDNTATQLKADNLINCKYALKAQYRNSSANRWAFHRDTIKAIRKLKDGEGNYLWKQGLSDRPDTILDIPFEESEYMPATFTTGLYVGILGDWSYYWIADAMSMRIQVLTELYAETNQNGYIGRMEVDGMPVLEEAFVRVKMG